MGNMTPENEAGEAGETEQQRLSKSARKREASSLQELGVKLSALPDQEIKELELPDSLFVALRALRRLPSHGAQVRQRQYIGKLMREIDPEPVLSRNLSSISCTDQATPVTPIALLPTAPTTPEVSVPWPSSSAGAPVLATALSPFVESVSTTMSALPVVSLTEA